MFYKINNAIRLQIEGQFNYLLDQAGLLPGDIKRLSEIRFSCCLLCGRTPHPANSKINGPGLLTNNRCRYAGNQMLAQTKVINAKCRIGNW